ncbi:unnamed protein product [Colias eurytheme]|nr:unnamed protein product [Colias eurytheme]
MAAQIRLYKVDNNDKLMLMMFELRSERGDARERCVVRRCVGIVETTPVTFTPRPEGGRPAHAPKGRAAPRRPRAALTAGTRTLPRRKLSRCWTSGLMCVAENGDTTFYGCMGQLSL